jgi:Fe-S oxidoreductase
MKTLELIQEFELLGCIQCGRCSGGCPMSLRTGLNVRRLIYEALIRDTMEVREKPEIWDCTTCLTCTTRCPKALDPARVLIGMRSVLVESGRIQPTIRDALESTFKHGNPWDRGRNKRSEWAEDLDVPNIAEVNEAEILFYVGCTPAYDTRAQGIAKAMVEAFHKAGVRFGTLGNDESCCASEARRMGEEGLFEIMVEDNVELFKECGADRMVTTSPHCYNTFTNEYEGLDNLQVQHYTQFVARLIEEGRLTFSGEVNKIVTYHDPCFLGKQNGVFEEPRAILKSIPGLDFREFDRSRERSLCCEGGGGRMWVEATTGGERLAEVRVKDAVAMGVEVIATACPFCLLTIEDAVKTTGQEEEIQVMDIMELVAQAI